MKRTALIVSIAVLGAVLSACGSQDAASQRAPEVSPVSRQVPNLTARQQSAPRRADAGECFSITHGPSADEWTEWAQRRFPLAGNEPALAELDREFEAYLVALPEGCVPTDQAAIDAALATIAARKAGAVRSEAPVITQTQSPTAHS